MLAYEHYHDWDLRNKDLARTLEHYVMHGLPPGGFTTAILAGDLFSAVGSADYWNKQNIAEIVSSVLQTCPQAALGSYQAVEDWCADKDERRSKYATWKLLQGPAKQQDDDDIPF